MWVTTICRSNSRGIPSKTFFNHILPTLLMGFTMTVIYLAGFHQPEPHHVPVGIVAQTPEATQAADHIQTALDDRVDIQVYPSETLAETLSNDSISPELISQARRRASYSPPPHTQKLSMAS